MNDREKIIYVVLLVGVLIAVPAVPALATAAFMTGHEKWGGVLLAAFSGLFSAFSHWEARRREKLGRTPLVLLRREESFSSRLFRPHSAPERSYVEQQLVKLEEANAMIDKRNAMIAEANAKANAAMDDPEALEALVTERMLDIIGLVTATTVQGEPDQDAQKAVLLGSFFPPEKAFDIETLAALKASSEVIAYMTVVLAAERGESVAVTWQREATNLSRIISEKRSS